MVATEKIPCNRVFGPVPGGYRRKCQEVDPKGCKCRGQRSKGDNNIGKDKGRNEIEHNVIEDEEDMTRWHDNIRFMVIKLYG